ncbi:hypothetical protein IMG5_203840 [Ichthyophthirius multifiliis]|uniref:Uncharacterized protein n=1 Tax=Ichthyophthirius multifiliis TaxID=5932 RepID=G0R6C1_ICHMU|nr:hypothetical protein IMG5_203840 [Ichthyophthirius multifiliis]EGR26985.1 hypothetical protein IMG5_203840 [Ichthyophthirius multifiliis]|eukprot:XP_004023869.1 hypothetical protein IMG5_203840 [Ichthyophthirius multifiliis]
MTKLLTIFILSLAISSTFAKIKLDHCLENAGAFADQAQTFIVEIKSHQMDVHKFLNETVSMIQQINTTLTSCNFKVPVFFPTQIANQTECIKDIESLVAEVGAIAVLIKEKKYLDILKLVEPLVQTLKSAQNDCKTQTHKVEQKILLNSIYNVHPIQCLKETIKFVREAKSLEIEIQQKHITEAINQTAVLLQELPNTLLDCGLNKLHDELKFLENIDFVHCGQDLTSLYTLGSNIHDDYKASNFSKLIQDGRTFFQVAIDLSAECQKKHASKFILQKQPFQDKINFNCLGKSFELIKELSDFVKSIKEKKYDVAILITQLQKVLKEAQPICDACGFDVKIPTIEVKDAEKCANDIANAINEIAQLVSDVQKKDFAHIVQDAENIIKIITSAVQDCKAI